MLYRLFCSVFIFCLVMELMYNELNTLNQCLYYFFCRGAHHTKVTKESNRIENRRVYIYTIKSRCNCRDLSSKLNYSTFVSKKVFTKNDTYQALALYKELQINYHYYNTIEQR